MKTDSERTCSMRISLEGARLAAKNEQVAQQIAPADGVLMRARSSNARIDSGKLIPVESWSMFAEKGGLKGAVDLLPLQDVVSALLALQDGAIVPPRR